MTIIIIIICYIRICIYIYIHNVYRSLVSMRRLTAVLPNVCY